MSNSRSTVPKIIIKARHSASNNEPEASTSQQHEGRPRRGRRAAAAKHGETEEEVDVEAEAGGEQTEEQDEGGGEEVEGDAEGELDVSVDGDDGDGEYNEDQGDDEDADAMNVDRPEAEPEPEVVVPAPRKRGRPRGRGRGGGFAGSTAPRPRGRPPGRGRARGRGRVTIKLPKRGDEDDEDGEGADVDARPFRKIQGQVYVIEGDEFVTPDDPKGDEKIDKHGNLLGGRKFKAQTFILPTRDPHRQYMLAIDAARTSGFRDSLYYFRRNLLALKLNATQPEKDYLIAEGKLGSHLRTRSVTLITARSAYKLHGAKMIVDGRWVIDDYYEEKSLAEITEKGLKAGDLVGELFDATAASSSGVPSGELAALDRSGALGASSTLGGSMYRPGGPTTIFGGSGWGPYSDGPLNAVRKSLLTRDGVLEENWMFMMAGRVREADEEWARWRAEARKALSVDGVWVGEVPVPGASNDKGKEVVQEGGDAENKEAEEKKPLGVYEPHSHLIHYRSDTQPTSARWEQLEDSKTDPLKRRVLGGTKAGNGAWGLAWVDTVMEVPEEPFDEHREAREWLWREVEREERERERAHTVEVS
ncbi:nuclear protein localization [Coprinopsis cinerea okayama7|uniref:Nuclear protein localization n=1 Tax=Coprinopsis cinerea (strain Okayama-7 / 130 / ATCC MYA-4618 / FGSC 9003) TaxID=240176 RepID=A8NZD9_COPC7|nr:nuclear protein localization [Coprinopsis cinerea okayama7\|eukprot:XP_001837656.2 nuclear protein localization [Coprinopsis cinerea okayama7\